MRHQQYVPSVPAGVKLYSGYAVLFVPLTELHVDKPDRVPYENVAVHVAVFLSYALYSPATDGSKIMAVVSFVIPMDIGIQFAKQTCLPLTSRRWRLDAGIRRYDDRKCHLLLDFMDFLS